MLVLMVAATAQAQTRMVLENPEKEKKIVIDTGDMIRAQFLADSVLHRSYRPRGYRRDDQRVSLVQGTVVGYTADGFTVVRHYRPLRRWFAKQTDTLTVPLDRVMALHKTSTFKLLGTSVLAQGVVRGAAFVTLTATGNFWIFVGLNVTGFVLSPFTRKYVRNATMPLRKLPKKRAQWQLRLEETPANAINTSY